MGLALTYLAVYTAVLFLHLPFALSLYLFPGLSLYPPPGLSLVILLLRPLEQPHLYDPPGGDPSVLPVLGRGEPAFIDPPVYGLRMRPHKGSDLCCADE